MSAGRQMFVESQLDRLLLHMLQQVPDWQETLSLDEVQLVAQRLAGASFRQLAVAYGLTHEGVRVRLYGHGVKSRRHGGILGQLRGAVKAEQHRLRLQRPGTGDADDHA